MKQSLQEKEQKLKEKLEKTQNQLKALKKKRQLEIGALAIKCGLSDVENIMLEKAFKRLAKELG